MWKQVTQTCPKIDLQDDGNQNFENQKQRIFNTKVPDTCNSHTHSSRKQKKKASKP